MKLSENFTLAEMTKTNCGLPNVPNVEQIHYLTLLCEKVLQPLRIMYGKPINVTSGFRSFEVNKHANNGLIKPSQHCKGQAVDIDNGYTENVRLFNILKTMEFDQLINEKNYGWIHVSYNPNGNRKQILKVI
jgi:uncharacterized protein YcbK (DUF882 family)